MAAKSVDSVKTLNLVCHHAVITVSDFKCVATINSFVRRYKSLRYTIVYVLTMELLIKELRIVLLGFVKYAKLYDFQCG